MAATRRVHATPPDWETLVDDCHRLGLRAVQLDGALLADALEHPERARVLDEAGIVLAGIGGYRNLVAPDESERRANVEYLCRCLELAPLLGTSIVATETGTRNREQPWAASPENRSPQALADLEESLAELLAVAERHGSILAVEGYVGHVLGTHAALQGVLDRFPTPSLQLVLDPYNYLSRHLLPAQERVTQAFLDRYEHRFVIAHAKDVGPGGAEESTPELGTGVFEQGLYLTFLERRRPDLRSSSSTCRWTTCRTRRGAASDRARATAGGGVPARSLPAVTSRPAHLRDGVAAIEGRRPSRGTRSARAWAHFGPALDAGWTSLPDPAERLDDAAPARGRVMPAPA